MIIDPHRGIIGRRAQSLGVVVVSDSETDGLSGFVGEMAIMVTPGRHDHLFRRAWQR
jgi:hypothetical protein